MATIDRRVQIDPALMKSTVVKPTATLRPSKCGDAVPAKSSTTTTNKRRRSKSEAEPQVQKQAKPRRSKVGLYPHEWVGCSPQEPLQHHNALGEVRSMRKAYREHAEKLKHALEKFIKQDEEKKAEKEKLRQLKRQHPVDSWTERPNQWCLEQKRQSTQCQHEFYKQQQQEHRRLQAERQAHLLRCQQEKKQQPQQPQQYLSEYEWRQKKMEECQRW